MRGLGLKALKPRVPSPKKPGPAQPDIGLRGLEGPASALESPSPAHRPGLLGLPDRDRSVADDELYSTSMTNRSSSARGHKDLVVSIFRFLC